MRWLSRVLLFVLLALPVMASAQLSTWEVVLFSGINDMNIPAELVVVTQDGISHRVTIPQNAFNNGSYGRDAMFSPDKQRVIATVVGEAPLGSPPIAIMDVASNSCCQFLEPPLDNVDVYFLGPFSPDGSQFAYSYFGFNDIDPSQVHSGLFTIQTATGDGMGYLPVETLRQQFPDAGFGAILPVLWNENGIYFVPTCWACEGTVESQYYVWNPATNAVSIATDAYYTIFGERLELTGELLYTTQNPAYPFSNEPSYFPPSNVVEYYPNGIPDTENANTGAPTIFNDPAMMWLGNANYVMDGQAMLVHDFNDTTNSKIVMRDGTISPLNLPADSTFLTGTGDGFLIQDSAYNLIEYSYNMGQWTPTTLSAFSGPLHFVSRTPLGGTVNEPFAFVDGTNVQPPPASSETCPGFMPSRLVERGQGRVTPGDPNRIRQEPSTSAAIVGQIPGGDMFNVLDARVCDPSGIAWWQIEYNGVVGWTAEGQGSAYFVEPVQ